MKIKIPIVFLFFLWHPALKAFCHLNVDGPGFEITSDFGPRIIDSSASFHQAIDWSRSEGESILLLENGTIGSIGFSKVNSVPAPFDPTRGGILIVVISGNAHTFRYLHMFNNTDLPIDSGDFTLAETTTTTTERALAIIKWSATHSGRAKYAISNYADREIIINGNPVLNEQGISIRTVRSVNKTNHPHIGPSGGSGGFTPHMHVDLGRSENPLHHIDSTASNFDVQFLDISNGVRADGYIVNPYDPDSMFIKVRVDSQAGKNLEKLELFVDAENSSNFLRVFKYGGQTSAHDPVNINILTNQNSAENGVQPIIISGNESTVGLENFIFNDWNTAVPYPNRPSNLPTGPHQLIARTTDIQNRTASFPINFNLQPCPSGPDTTAPEITLDPDAYECQLPGPYELRGILSDNCSDPLLSVNSQPVQLFPTGNEHEFSFSELVNLNQGVNQIFLEAIDASNNFFSLPHEITVDQDPPQIQSLAPGDGALDIPTSAIIQARFDGLMSGGQIFIHPPVAGTSSLFADTITFDPNGLPPDKTFTATATGLADVCGNSAPDVSWTFSTSNIENEMDEPPGQGPGNGASSWSNADQVCVSGQINVPAGGPTSMQVCAGSLGCETVLI